MFNQVDGLLLVNKPKTWTSFDLCNFIKCRFRIKKVGHTGTLDPQATGVMIILLGRFTRLSKFLMEQVKGYRGTLRLGIRTDSQDGDGRVVEEKPWDHIKEEEIYRTVAQFKGTIFQKPPMVSAVKHHGKRLYKLARLGKVVERDVRPIEVYQFDIERIHMPRIDFYIEVSKGTYVRTLAEDFGEKLGSTAFLESLCRTQIGAYSLDECVEVKELEQITTTERLKSILIRDIREDYHTHPLKEPITSRPA